MANSRISDLTLATAAALANELEINEAGASKRINVTQLRNLIAPRGYIFGLNMANDPGDTANDIEVQPGEAMAESHDEVMTLPAIITKRLDAAWAVGDNQGGLNTGGEAANTWYEVHLIKRVDTGVVDVMFTTTGNRATLPANYTKQRRIGWIRNDGSSNILQFVQVEDRFTLVTPINDVAASKTTTAAAVTLTVPPNTIARFRASCDSNATVNANAAMLFKENVETGANPVFASGVASLGYPDVATAAAGGHFELRVSATSQITHDAEVAQTVFDISTFGWIDHRRRLADL